MIKRDLRESIRKAVGVDLPPATLQRRVQGGSEADLHLEHPANPEHGDYSSNVALTLKGAVAEEIVKHFPKNDYLEKVEVAPPGFINFYLKTKVFTDELEKILKEKDHYGSSKIGEGKTVIVDYSSPNIAKPFGIGHLRSTIIGQTLYNLYKTIGYKVIGDNHIGDWGTQFGKLIYAIKTWGDEKAISKDPIKKLNELYVRFHREAEEDISLEEEGRRWFKKLEDGDKEARRIWQKCVDWSSAEFDRIYNLLGIKIDLALGESFYEPMLKDVIQEAVDKGVAVESEGALIIKFPNDKLPPVIIRKSDGATTYMTRDLATIKYRREKFRPFRIIYETGVDHTLHFRQLFWAAERLGWGNRADYVHVGHGMMRLKTGRMKTRAGDTILLEEVLNEAVRRAATEAIGIGAVKYNDLKQHPTTNIVFDWDTVLNLRGDSGPYLQYAYTRARSIIRKADFDSSEVTSLEYDFSGCVEELDLAKLLSRFPEVVVAAAESYAPSIVCSYLFDLAQCFNLFYEKVPVLPTENEVVKVGRLALTAATAQVIKNGLSLLGISAPEKM